MRDLLFDGNLLRPGFLAEETFPLDVPSRLGRQGNFPESGEKENGLIQATGLEGGTVLRKTVRVGGLVKGRGGVLA